MIREWKFANPRNAASGAIRQLDSNVSKSRKLSSFIYAIPNASKYNINSQNEILEFIKNQGFQVNNQHFFIKKTLMMSQIKLKS